MIKIAPLDLAGMISIDEQGIPYAPNVYQIQDRQVRELYLRDTGSPDDPDSSLKLRYLREAGVVYYLGDPKSPPNQMGKSRPEALKDAKTNYGLPDDWEPDALILALADRYHKDKIGVAGEAVEALNRGLHNVVLAANIINEQLSLKMQAGLQSEDALTFIDYSTKLNNLINGIPNQIKALTEARQSLTLELEQKKARGGQVVTTSMSSADAADLEKQIEEEKRNLGLIKKDAISSSLRGKPLASYESTK